MAKYFTNEQLSGQIVKEATFTVLKTSSSQEILDIPGGEDVVSTRWNSDGALMVDVIHPNGGKGRYFFLGQHVRYGGILPDDCSSNRPTSSSDLRRYMSDMQAANQQREGGSSSSQGSSSGSTSASFAKGVAAGAAVVGAIGNWADKREAKKLEKKAAEVAAKAVAAQEEREEEEREEQEREEWWHSLSPEEQRFRDKLDELDDRKREDHYREYEKIEKLPMPSEENFIKEYNGAIEKSKNSNKTPKYILDCINSYSGILPEDIADYLKNGDFDLKLNFAWEKRTKALRDYALEHYMDNPEIRQLFAKEYQEKVEEDTKNKKNKKIAKFFWSIYAIVALILLIMCEEWWEYVLVILGLILAAIIRGVIRLAKS